MKKDFRNDYLIILFINSQYLIKLIIKIKNKIKDLTFDFDKSICIGIIEIIVK
jgi:hypothetical protein